MFCCLPLWTRGGKKKVSMEERNASSHIFQNKPASEWDFPPCPWTLAVNHELGIQPYSCFQDHIFPGKKTDRGNSQFLLRVPYSKASLNLFSILATCRSTPKKHAFHLAQTLYVNSAGLFHINLNFQDTSYSLFPCLSLSITSSQTQEISMDWWPKQ